MQNIDEVSEARQEAINHHGSRSGPTSKAPSQRDRILEALRSAGAAGVSNLELSRVGGLRFGGRVHELRGEGYKIAVVRGDAEGNFIYILTAEPHASNVPASTSSIPAGDNTKFMNERHREAAEAMPLFATFWGAA